MLLPCQGLKATPNQEGFEAQGPAWFQGSQNETDVQPNREEAMVMPTMMMVQQVLAQSRFLMLIFFGQKRGAETG